MVEANHTLQQAQLRTRLHFAANTLARQAALKSTKRRLQAPGLKVNHFPLRELKLRAEAYLAEHREELITEVKTGRGPMAARGLLRPWPPFKY